MPQEEIRQIIEDGFLDIVDEIFEPSPEKLRVVLKDKSFVDIRISRMIKGRFDFHWERTHIDGTIYRYDNFPDNRYRKLKTFPFHFHQGKEGRVVGSNFSKKMPNALVDFMCFAREKLQNNLR